MDLKNTAVYTQFEAMNWVSYYRNITWNNTWYSPINSKLNDYDTIN